MRTACLPQAAAAVVAVAVVAAAVVAAAKLSVMNHPEAKPPALTNDVVSFEQSGPNFLKQIIFLKSFYSVFSVIQIKRVNMDNFGILPITPYYSINSMM